MAHDFPGSVFNRAEVCVYQGVQEIVPHPWYGAAGCGAQVRQAQTGGTAGGGIDHRPANSGYGQRLPDFAVWGHCRPNMQPHQPAAEPIVTCWSQARAKTRQLPDVGLDAGQITVAMGCQQAAGQLARAG